MSTRKPLMPKATAVWLVENTSISFEQIADFCGLHNLEVKGIADGDVAQGIKGLDPISSGQLTREQIARAEAAANTTFLAGDAYATGLPDAGFDLVHVRFLASTAGQPERLVAEALRLARPGGVVAFQEADFLTLNCYPPHPAWKALRDALAGCFPQTGEDPTAQRIFRLLRQGGLREVEYRPVLVGVRSGDPWQDYLPATIESLRGAVIARGLITEAMFDRQLAECRRHLAEAGTVFTSYTIVQTWGRVAAPGT